jgi:hypothetical protein
MAPIHALSNEFFDTLRSRIASARKSSFDRVFVGDARMMRISHSWHF